MLDIALLAQQAEDDLVKASDLLDVEKIRIKYLGKKGLVTAVFKTLSSLDGDDKKETAARANTLKKNLLEKLLNKKQQLAQQKREASILDQAIDVTLPAYCQFNAGRHPIRQTITLIESLFSQYGFDVVEGPEIEDDFHNFTALNIPAHHPARAMHDTFYVDDNTVLRTHTSPVQIRTLEQEKPPFKIIAPGKVYRCDSDVTHTPMFHQIEGLIVDEGVTFIQLKGLLMDFLKVFFDNDDLAIRFRPSYFPFTEPSAEVDIACLICQGKGCRACKSTGWLEVLGCGSVHPNVFKFTGIDDNFQGVAFGMGIERLTMLKYGINDLRLFFEGDYRFLKQFH